MLSDNLHNKSNGIHLRAAGGNPGELTVLVTRVNSLLAQRIDRLTGRRSAEAPTDGHHDALLPAETELRLFLGVIVGGDFSMAKHIVMGD